MLINLQIDKYYKVENKMTGRCRSKDSNDRIFEKKDYAFPIKSINEDQVTVTYLGEDYTFETEHARHNFRDALTFQDIKDFIVLKYITGSKAYGTDVESSDTDYKAVFIFPDSWYSRFDFNPDWEEIKEKNHDTNEEITYYSLRKFVSLLAVNNPNMLEVFDIPDDCIVYKDKCIDIILESQNVFLSKLCYKSFLGYGESQIRKADGQDKMSNWEKTDMQRKSPIDFCFTFKGQGSLPITEWLEQNGMEQRFCGISSIDHMRDIYGLYYDHVGHTVQVMKDVIDGIRPITDFISNKICYDCLNASFTNDITFESITINNIINMYHWYLSTGATPIGFPGIVMDDSNDVRKCDTPKGAIPIAFISYNKDGYSTHCKLYNKYLTWRKERNDARWTDVEGHNQKIDGKNMLHCMRLIYMSEDIANGKGIIVRRPEAEYLKSIRFGKVELKKLIETASQKLADLETAFNGAILMEEPDAEEVTNIYNKAIAHYNMPITITAHELDKELKATMNQDLADKVYESITQKHTIK